MYHRFYNLGVAGYQLAIRLAAPFNRKAKAWIQGRKDIWRRMANQVKSDKPLIWIHAASLGEAEQGLPIISQLKKLYPNYRILLSFFSPSGMENFKRHDLAEYVCYLPADKPENARKFIDIIQPKLALFIKYEIWANYFLELQNRNIPVIIAPAVFRADQFYFKAPHRNFFLPILKNTSAILTQDENSVDLLRQNGILNCAKVGDSRFEKVLENAHEDFSDPLLEAFAKNSILIVCGSTWSPDEEMLLKLAKALPDLKLILAPHDISKTNVNRVLNTFGDRHGFLYSEAPADISEKRYVVIDNIGMLSKLYRLGQMAYVGGAFGQGIHNSLEAAVYGMPVFFGPKHTNFIEPSDMIKAGFGHEVKTAKDLIEEVRSLIEDEAKLEAESRAGLDFVEQGTGATDKIVEEIKSLLG